MAGTTDGPGNGTAWRRLLDAPRRTWLVVAAVAALVLAVAAAIVVPRLGDDVAGPGVIPPAGGSTASPTTDPTDAPSAMPTEPSPTPTADGSPAPTEPAAEPTEAAPEGPGEIRPTAEPVPLDAPAAPTAEVSATITSIEPVIGEANVPGEVGGPSLRVTVTITNETAERLDLTSAVVNLYYGPDRTPAISLLQPGQQDFPTSVDAGRGGEGVFVFRVPPEERGDVLIELDLSVDATVVLFTGAAPV